MSRKMRIRLVVAILAWGCGSTIRSVAAADVQIYVSPQGNDGWSGRLAEPNSERTDGPLATLTAARDAIRQWKQTRPAEQSTRVLLRGGVYQTDVPIVFGPDDSGTAIAPITYAAYPHEQPVISGGRRIDGWRPAADGMWSTTIPQVKSGEWFFRQLFVNGRRAIPARTPNEGVFQPAGPLRPLGDREAARRDASTQQGFRYRNDDLTHAGCVDDAVVVYYHAWTTSRHLIQNLDVDERTIHFRNPSVWPFGWWGDDERYYIEAFRDALDAPGEFYLDRSTGILTYLPREGEQMDAAVVVAPVSECLLRFEGDAAAGRPVEYLHFEGLSFQHAAWNMPSEGRVDGQAAAFLDTATVFARGTCDCEFTRCEIAHTGGYALWLENGCQRNRVEQCHLHDLGAGGVRLGQTRLPHARLDQAERNEILNCFIHNGGQVFHAGVGVWIGQSSHNRVIHNDICDFYYTGVSVGWSWGYAPSTAHHNAIEYNHIHHLGWRQLSDMGGIYCLGISPGTCLRYNLIHDVMSYPAGYGGWGLYTDEGSTGILIENNVVYRTKDGGFHQHYGRDNIVQNNVLAFSCGRGQVVRTRDEAHRSFAFERNIVYYHEPPLLGGNWNHDDGFQIDNNLYWQIDGSPPSFPGNLSFAKWQERGHDVHSLIADPQFLAPDRYDFRLPEDSPARQLGFVPIDIQAAGLTGTDLWTSLPAQVQRPPFVMPWEE